MTWKQFYGACMFAALAVIFTPACATKNVYKLSNNHFSSFSPHFQFAKFVRKPLLVMHSLNSVPCHFEAIHFSRKNLIPQTRCVLIKNTHEQAKNFQKVKRCAIHRRNVLQNQDEIKTPCAKGTLPTTQQRHIVINERVYNEFGIFARHKYTFRSWNGVRNMGARHFMNTNSQ